MPHVEKEGWMKKRIGRMHRWTNRYFTLIGSNISYKVKVDTDKVKDSFDLSPGCVVTEVREEKIRGHSGKSFVFWVVWPHDKHDKGENEKAGAGEESDDELEKKEDVSILKEKQLKDIVQKEMHQQQNTKKVIAEQIELHDAHDKTMSFGAKVGAAAAGAVVIGVLTAGIGLIPYAVGVGMAAAASGGAIALQYRRPADSRLILACDTMHEALAWKVAIENQIANLESKPTLPVFADPNVIMNIIDISKGNAQWRRREIIEGMRIMEIGPIPNEHTKSMKAQVVLHHTPLSVFLSLMDKQFWPSQGNVKGLKTMDDHADIVGVDVLTNCGKYGGPSAVLRRICLSRFWRMDDDGVYMISYNSAKHDSYQTKACLLPRGTKLPRLPKEEFMGSPTPKSHVQEPFADALEGADCAGAVAVPHPALAKSPEEEQPSIDAVFTISPRADHAEYDEEVMECIVTCTVQVSTEGNWKKGESDAFMEDFLTQNLLELRYSLSMGRYFHCSKYDDRAETSKTEGSLVTPRQAVIEPDMYVFKDRERWRERENRSESGSRSSSNMRGVASKDEREAPLSHGEKVPESRGITIMQPGQEEPQPRILRSLRSTSEDEHRATNPGRRKSFTGMTKSEPKDKEANPSRRRLSLFTKKESHNTVTSMSHDSHEDSPGNDSPNAKLRATGKLGHGSASPLPNEKVRSSSADRASRYVSRSASRGRSRNRSTAINNEASALRGQIATKEYELKRMEKMQAQRNKNKDAAMTVSDTVAKQTADLARLKMEYQRLTGVSYEQSGEMKRRRRLLGGWANSHTSSSSNRLSPSAHSTTGSLDSPPKHTGPTMSETSASEAAISLARALQQQMGEDDMRRRTSESNGNVPHFWSIPTRELRCDVSAEDADIAFASAVPRSYSTYVEEREGSADGPQYAILRPHPKPAMAYPSFRQLLKRQEYNFIGEVVDAFGMVGSVLGFHAPHDGEAKEGSMASVGVILWFVVLLYISTAGHSALFQWIN